MTCQGAIDVTPKHLQLIVCQIGVEFSHGIHKLGDLHVVVQILSNNGCVSLGDGIFKMSSVTLQSSKHDKHLVGNYGSKDRTFICFVGNIWKNCNTTYRQEIEDRARETLTMPEPTAASQCSCSKPLLNYLEKVSMLLGVGPCRSALLPS